MIKSLGIIAEFNPFHQGHEYLIEKAKKMTGADVCVAVMSGNFTQRGAPTVYDKWTRARFAIEHGVNLVAELPTVYACNSAEYFASGGVKVLEGFGLVDTIAFGSENGNIDKLQATADFFKENDGKLKVRIKELMKKGDSYPKAREIASMEIDPLFCEKTVKSPNDILAVEYLKQISTMKAYTVKRRGSGYHASSKMIRAELMENEPDKFERMNRSYFELVGAKILQSDSKHLECIFSAGEGLGNKLKNEIRYVSSTNQLIERIKSKAYTRSRISRLLTQVLLDIDENDINNAQSYIRILALDEVGAKFIKEVKKSGKQKLPIITNINKEIKENGKIKKTLDKDILASDMYNIINGNDLYDFSDYILTPYLQL